MEKGNKKVLKIVLNIVLDIVILFLVALCGLFAFFKFTYSEALVCGPSMYPTLNGGTVEDVVGINEKAKYSYGDIITCELDNADDEGNSITIVKRVIAMAGDYVDIDYNEKNELVIILNGKILEEPYLVKRVTKEDDPISYSHWKLYIKTTQGITYEEGKGLLIGEDEVFLMGDNRLVSNDSTTLGPLKTNKVQGKVEFIYKKNQSAFKAFLQQVIFGIK